VAPTVLLFYYFADADGNCFIRKGKVGDWKNHFDDQMNQDWDPWIEDQLKGSDFKMEFE
jgi:hypothetical protein